MLENLVSWTTLISAVIAAGVSIVGSYLSVRLTLKDHANELENLRKEVSGLREELGRLQRACAEHEAGGHREETDSLADELAMLESKLNQRLEAFEKRFPNCDAHRAEFIGRLDAIRAEIQVVLLTKLMEIAEQNSHFREDLRQRFMTDTQEITRELLSPAAVTAIVDDRLKQIRADDRRDIDFLFKRLTELEARR
jgi:DNA repair exonuclease SbcCD ATPase subunit